jgi:hypothetical protein
LATRRRRLGLNSRARARPDLPGLSSTLTAQPALTMALVVRRAFWAWTDQSKWAESYPRCSVFGATGSPSLTPSCESSGVPQTGAARRPIARPSPLIRREPKLRHAGKRRSPHHRFPKLVSGTAIVKERRTHCVLRDVAPPSQIVGAQGPTHLHGRSRPYRAGQPSVNAEIAPKASRDLVRAPSSAPRTALGHFSASRPADVLPRPTVLDRTAPRAAARRATGGRACVQSHRPPWS